MAFISYGLIVLTIFLPYSSSNPGVDIFPFRKVEIHQDGIINFLLRTLRRKTVLVSNRCSNKFKPQYSPILEGTFSLR